MFRYAKINKIKFFVLMTLILLSVFLGWTHQQYCHHDDCTVCSVMQKSNLCLLTALSCVFFGFLFVFNFIDYLKKFIFNYLFSLVSLKTKLSN